MLYDLLGSFRCPAPVYRCVHRSTGVFNVRRAAPRSISHTSRLLAGTHDIKMHRFAAELKTANALKITRGANSPVVYFDQEIPPWTIIPDSQPRTTALIQATLLWSTPHRFFLYGKLAYPSLLLGP